MAIFQCPKNICQRLKFVGKSQKFRSKSDFHQISVSNFQISEPEKMQFHTPSHSIRPLESLLIWFPCPLLLLQMSMIKTEGQVRAPGDGHKASKASENFQQSFLTLVRRFPQRMADAASA